jgi:hypothetical protein
MPYWVELRVSGLIALASSALGVVIEIPRVEASSSQPDTTLTVVTLIGFPLILAAFTYVTVPPIWWPFQERRLEQANAVSESMLRPGGGLWQTRIALELAACALGLVIAVAGSGRNGEDGIFLIIVGIFTSTGVLCMRSSPCVQGHGIQRGVTYYWIGLLRPGLLAVRDVRGRQQMA